MKGLDSINCNNHRKCIIACAPSISVDYDVSVSLNGSFAWIDISSGNSVIPSKVSAPHSTHNFTYTSISGVPQSFSIQAIDSFGNSLTGTLPPDNDFIACLSGTPRVCGSFEEKILQATVDYNYFSDKTKCVAKHTSNVSEIYEAKILLHSQGSLLATYFKNDDFCNGACNNSCHLIYPHHETYWCPN